MQPRIHAHVSLRQNSHTLFSIVPPNCKLSHWFCRFISASSGDDSQETKGARLNEQALTDAASALAKAAGCVDGQAQKAAEAFIHNLTHDGVTQEAQLDANDRLAITAALYDVEVAKFCPNTSKELGQGRTETRVVVGRYDILQLAAAFSHNDADAAIVLKLLKHIEDMHSPGGVVLNTVQDLEDEVEMSITDMWGVKKYRRAALPIHIGSKPLEIMHGTPLHLAAVAGNLQAVRALLLFGSDAETITGQYVRARVGVCTIMCLFTHIVACSESCIGSVVAVLTMYVIEQSSSKLTLSQYLAVSRFMEYDSAFYMESKSVDWNAPKTKAKTALTLIAQIGKANLPEVARIRVEQGAANIEVQDYKGWTPLIIASNFGQVELVETLCQLGCDLNAAPDLTQATLLPQNAYWTALRHAVGYNRVGVIECLLRNGADPNVVVPDETKLSQRVQIWIDDKNKRNKSLEWTKLTSKSPEAEQHKLELANDLMSNARELRKDQVSMTNKEILRDYAYSSAGHLKEEKVRVFCDSFAAVRDYTYVGV